MSKSTQDARLWSELSDFEKGLFQVGVNVTVTQRIMLRCYWTWLGLKHAVKSLLTKAVR